MTTINEAKALIRGKLAEGGYNHKLTARTIHFTDLARVSMIFVKVHGWSPHPYWGELRKLASDNGFRVE